MLRGNAAKHAQIPFHGRRETEQRDVFHEHKHALLSDLAEIFVRVMQQATVCLKVKGEERFAFFFCSIGLRAKRRRSDDRDFLEITSYATYFLSI